MEQLTQPESASTDRRATKTGVLARSQIVAVTLFAVLASTFYIVTYVNYPNHYPVGHNLSWWGWFDQGRYIASTKAIRAGDLRPSEHHYPVGYPALGAVFYDLMPNDPYVIPNFLCFATICTAFILICRRLVTLIEALILCFVGVVWQASVRNNLVVAWSSIPRDAALYALAWLAMFRCGDPMYPVFSGLCFAVIYAMRPGDILSALPLLVMPLAAAVRGRRLLPFVGRFALAAAPIVIAIHLFNYLVYDALFPKVYFEGISGIGFSLSFIPVKALSLFIDPQLLYGESGSLVAAFPYLLLVLPGAAVFVKRFRAVGVAIVAAQTAALLYYLAFNDFLPSNVFRFQLIHYIEWLLPWFLLYAYLSFRLAWRELGILPTAALLGLSVMLFLLPNVAVKSVSGGPQQTIPAVLSQQPGEATFAGPAGEFDTVLLADLRTTDIEVGLDNRVLHLRKDFQATLPEGNPGVTVMFYSPQHASSVRIKASGAATNSLASTRALYFKRQWSLTFRNPRTFLAQLPASFRFISILADHGSSLADMPIAPCTQPPLRIEGTEIVRGLVRRAAFPNMGSDGSPNLRFSLISNLPYEAVVNRVFVQYSAGGQWSSTSSPGQYPSTPNLWGAIFLGSGTDFPGSLYHFKGSCGSERLSVVIPLATDSAEGNFDIRLDTSRGGFAASVADLKLHIAH